MMLCSLLVVILVVAIAYLYPTLQNLVEIGGGYTSKAVCAGVFLSGRELHTIRDNELSGLSALLFVPAISKEERSVTSSLFGIPKWASDLLSLASPTALYLGPHFGCQLQIPDTSGSNLHVTHDFERLRREDKLFLTDFQKVGARRDLIKLAESVNPCIQHIFERQFSLDGFKQNQTRAAVVARSDGTIVAEAYQTEFLGITEATKLLGWSMTKSMFAMILGAGIQQQLLTLDTPLKLSFLTKEHRAKITQRNGGKSLTFGDLLHMSDVLHIEEDYGIFQNVVKMLYKAHNAVQYAAGGDHIDENGVGRVRSLPLSPTDKSAFSWYYSSGVSNLLSYEFRTLFKNDKDYWAFPHKYLFNVIGAQSFSMELDPSGTIVASSFGYATARDWTKLGLLMLNKGMWHEPGYESVRVLPEHFVEQVQLPHPASGGHYGGQFWLNPARVSVAEYSVLPHSSEHKSRKAWMATAMPPDAYYMSGHEGQTVFIIPSLDLVITRLGFTREQVLVDSVVFDGDGREQKVKKSSWESVDFFGEIVKCVK